MARRPPPGKTTVGAGILLVRRGSSPYIGDSLLGIDEGVVDLMDGNVDHLASDTARSWGGG